MTRYLLLTGGVGGARLCDGFYRSSPPEELCMLVNTGDDFEHCGLHISPDLDTLLYTLSGLSDTQRGWGLADESWTALQQLGELGGETWFQLGDRDLAMHLRRTALLRKGQTLEEVVRLLAAALDIKATLIPMTNQPQRTMIHTSNEVLEFQDYFVRRRCEPIIERIEFRGAETAQIPEALLEQLEDAALEKIVICPSNPFVSVAPILAVPQLKAALTRASAPVIAVSPIVGGQAIKGPAAAMLAQLGYEVSAYGVARYYAETAPGLVDSFIVDDIDTPLIPEISSLGMDCKATSTVMHDADARCRLAAWLCDFPISDTAHQGES